MSSNPDISRQSHQEQAEYVKRVVTQEGARLRQRFPLLKQQNAIGAAILALSWAGMLASAAGYVQGALPAWATIGLVAFFASFTHELEHDLIHWMYFRQKPWAHHLMMALVWLARPSTINPWLRREIHFNHHKHSGTERDIEERAITNGERWGLRRFLMTGDNMLSVLLRLHRAPNRKLRVRMLTRTMAAYFPLGLLHWALWYVFLAVHALAWAGHPVDASWVPALNTLVVVWIAPNVWRTFCLHFVSSNMHYYGDIEDGNVIQQCQVLTPVWMWPFQLFCCNFGSTHAIHHFVVKEPFYVRQMTAPVAHRVMREVGVRFNDIGTFSRANRWRADVRSATVPSSAGKPA
ncbi:MAG: fatty acid desaturase [Leptothrix sp. (in: Bacteria)]|nr:fatty acid desaturase [Leptothrix sp. (in: b-proteobacteria)]